MKDSCLASTETEMGLIPATAFIRSSSLLGTNSMPLILAVEFPGLYLHGPSLKM